MSRIKKIPTEEALRLASEIFDFSKYFPEYLLRKKYTGVLFLSCINGLWTPLNYLWNILIKNATVFSNESFYLTSLDIIRFKKNKHLANNSYEIKMPVSFKELVNGIKREKYIYDVFYLELILFNLSHDFVMYVNEDFSVFLIAIDNKEINSKIFSKIKNNAIDNNYYLGDNFKEFTKAIKGKLGYSINDAKKFEEWF